MSRIYKDDLPESEFPEQALSRKTIGCPYCGESIKVLIDPSDIEQQYIEDCQVCCQPINFVISTSINGDISISVYSDNESF